jgi:hydrophobic/amphiphilic exporter-1 (mainly G- bacteria), HAE1 family
VNSVYRSPLRVYLVLALLGLLGVYSGYRLPISLFPIANHPEIHAHIGLGNLSPDEFLNSYGRDLEEKLKSLQSEGVGVEKVRASYHDNEANFSVTFRWGVKPAEALRETQSLVTSFSSRFAQESRDNTWVWMQNQNSGFLALSIYSEKRSLTELYDLLEPVLIPKLSSALDAQSPVLWNPASEEIRVELKPEALASLQLYPKNIQLAISAGLAGRSGGEIPVGNERLSIELPRQIQTLADLSETTIATPSGQLVTLSELAQIDRGPKSSGRQSFRTSGIPSLILWASPRPGGNVKRMAEEVLAITRETLSQLPGDIHYKTLVDPSEFVRAAVRNVLVEVLIAALLAVAVLFVFIGSPRNILTAAIEIPLSIVLAFILMRLFGMNLNLISLGGLALSAGMNVDASVVVLENILRHFEEEPGPHSFQRKLAILTSAVREVTFPILASTLVSIIVFLPLAATQGLSQSILGDLALAVIFSHGCSALVALLLVPTVRLQLMALNDDKPTPSPFEPWLKRFDALYVSSLEKFLNSNRSQIASYLLLPIALGLLVVFILPRLPRELLGRPDSEWINLGIGTEGNSVLRQMEALTEETERAVVSEFGDKIEYQFSEAYGPNNGRLMIRLKHRSQMEPVWKALEARFPPTPLIRYNVQPWNPSELPIPDPPHFAMQIRGGSSENRRIVAKSIQDLLRDEKVFPIVYSDPSSTLEYSVRLSPTPAQVETLRSKGGSLTVEDLADLARVATTGRWGGFLPTDSGSEEILLYFPKATTQSVEEVGAIPVGLAGKVLPLRALADVKRVRSPPRILRENGRPLYRLEARRSRGETALIDTSKELAETKVTAWLAANPKYASQVNAVFVDPAPEISEAISELMTATGLSVLLIFFTLIFQFGTFVEPLLVLVALPLGYIGVLIALYVSGSTLSLNSVLGVILLNGIAVANSILLVDFTKRLFHSGLAAREAAIKAAGVRLRPILITSLTTILGMTPLAIGLGEGGKILQPLGIAVVGGMWCSLGLTLFIVPSLHLRYLQFRRVSLERWATQPALVFILICAALSPSEARATASLDYLAAVQAIVERNPDVGQAEARVRIVRGRNLPSTLALLPAISLQARKDAREEFGLDASRLGAAASIDFNLFRFGADYSAMRAAGKEIEAEQAQLAAITLRTESSAAGELNRWIMTTLDLEILARLTDARKNLLQIAGRRYDRGLIPKQEIDKLEIDLENDRALQRDADMALVQSSSSIIELLGHHEVERTWPWKKRLASTSAKVAHEETLTLRPDWVEAALRVSAAEHRAAQAWGRMFPSLDFSLSYGFYQARSGSASLDRAEYSTSLVLSFPLFDRLSSYGEFAAQSESLKSTTLALERVKRAAKREWDSAKQALPLAVESALAREKTLLVSRGLYQDALARFERGLSEANDLNIDQQRLLQSERLAIQGWASAHTLFASYCLASGRRLKACVESD